VACPSSATFSGLVCQQSMKHLKTLFCLLLYFSIVGCGEGEDSQVQAPTNPAPAAVAPDGDATFTTPVAVVLQGYDGEAMEPFLSRDGRLIFFNNRNDDPNTDLHIAERVDDFTFRYRGLVNTANTPDSLEGVPTMSRSNEFFFISTREYFSTLTTVFTGTFTGNDIDSAQPLSELATAQLGQLIFDIEVSADGQTLLLAEGTFNGGPVPIEANFVLARRVGATFQFVADDDTFQAVNTDAREYAAALSSDGLVFMFTRLPQGSVTPQIYLSRRGDLNSPFEQPSLVQGLQEFVEAATFSPDDRLFYYHARVDGQFRLFVFPVP
jgi:hypothetical protein